MDSFLSQVISAVIVIVSMYCIALLWLQRASLKGVKGPIPLPLLGNAYDKRFLVFIKYITEMKKEYGKLYVVYAFTTPLLIVTDPIVVREILTNPKLYKRTRIYRSICFSIWSRINYSDSEQHAKDKKLFAKYFNPSNVSKYSQKVNDTAKKTIKEKLESNLNEPINIEGLFAVLSLRVFMNFSFGKDFSDDPILEQSICHKISHGSNLVGKLCVLPGYFLNLYPWAKTVVQSARDIFNAFQKIIDNRIELLKNGSIEVVDDCLSEMIKEGMTTKMMQDHVVTFLSAGHDTTAMFMSYLYYLLAQYPEVQDKVRREIVSVMNGRDNVMADDFVQMKYLAKVMQETLRLYAIVPLIARTTYQEVQLESAKVKIPKGQQILLSFTVMNRDESLWDKPNEFNPDRFEELGADFTTAQKGFFPFGYGTRACIGKTLAQVETCIIIAQSLRKYRIEKEIGFRPVIVSGMSLTTAHGIRVILRELTAAPNS